MRPQISIQHPSRDNFQRNPASRSCPPHDIAQDLQGMQSDMEFKKNVSRYAQPHALLDDQRPHGLPQRNGGMHLARLEACRVTSLGGTPVDHPGENAPFVAGVKLHPAGLVEVVEGELAVDGGLAHCLKRGGICRENRPEIGFVQHIV